MRDYLLDLIFGPIDLQNNRCYPHWKREVISRLNILIQYISCNGSIDTSRSRKMWIFIVLVIPGILAQDVAMLEIESTTPMYQDTTAPEQEEVLCPSNMLFDSSENECECVAKTVYYPPKDSCFNPFEQGPCESGHYLAVPKDADVAECVVNTCGNNGTVPYKNSCYFLLTSGPCKSTEALQISENALELECREVNTVVYQIIDAPAIGCLPGTRRIARKKCRRLI